MQNFKFIISKIINFSQIISSVNIFSSFKINPCDVIFFNHDADRAVTLNKKAYSPLIDSIREEFEELGYVCSTVALPWSNYTGKRAHGLPININKFILIDLLFNYLNKFFLLSLNREDTYQKILKYSDPKLIISIGCTNNLCFEARKNNIFHVEILHGIGYSTIPWGWSSKSSEHLPQGILALDNTSYQTFIPLSIKDIDVKIIPHPFLRRFILNDSDKIPIEWLTKKNCNKNWKKEILISLQWAYAGDHDSYVEYENILKNGLFYEEIELLIKEEKDILFRFRFHPIHLKNKKYKFLFEFMDKFIKIYPNTEWVESSSLPYASIVKDCSGNISMSSMSCYDAAVFGVNTLMLCPTIYKGGIYEDWFVDLEDEGYVQKSMPSFAILKDWVLNTQKQKPRISNLNDKDLWEASFKWMIDKSHLSKRIYSNE
jgi:hypothetical protein